jgi:septum formation inhibitor MinC
LHNHFYQREIFFNHSKQTWGKWDINAVKELAGQQGVVLVSDSKTLAKQARNFQPIELTMNTNGQYQQSPPQAQYQQPPPQIFEYPQTPGYAQPAEQPPQ